MTIDRGTPGNDRETILRTEKITKRFGDVVANDSIDFELRKGEIHGLLGENGSGKTTFCRILYGLLKPDSGRIIYMGREVRFNSPRDAIASGIGMVHQELSLIPNLTVSENIAMLHGRGFKIDRRDIYERLLDLGEKFGLEVPPDVPVYKLSFGERQRIEIIKAVYSGVKVLILDEPTSYLTKVEVENLSRVLKEMKRSGITIIFVSHKISEIMELTDRVTVLRRGRVVGRGITREMSESELVKLIIGDKDLSKPALAGVEPRESGKDKPVLLRVKGLTVLGDLGQIAVDSVDLEIRSGEILGIAGVEGNGQKELIEAIAGIRKPVKGEIYIGSVNATGMNSYRIRKLGVCYIPDDSEMALLSDARLFKNIAITPPAADLYVRDRVLRIFNFRTLRNAARKLIERFRIVAESEDTYPSNLSGGNKQKLVVARELHTEPRIILAYCPTKGLDIATANSMRNYLVSEKMKGKAILLVSTDMDELLEISDRIAVMYKGKIAAVFDRERFDPYIIAYAMTTGKPKER